MNDEIRLRYHWSEALLLEVGKVSASEMAVNPKRTMIWRMLILPIIVAAAMFAISEIFPSSPKVLLGILIGFVVANIYFGILLKRENKQFVESQMSAPSNVGEISMTLSSQGFHAENALFVQQFDWRAFEAVVEGDLALHLMLSSSMSMPIPYASLPADMTRDALKQRVDTWWRVASDA